MSGWWGSERSNTGAGRWLGHVRSDGGDCPFMPTPWICGTSFVPAPLEAQLFNLSSDATTSASNNLVFSGVSRTASLLFVTKAPAKAAPAPSPQCAPCCSVFKDVAAAHFRGNKTQAPTTAGRLCWAGPWCSLHPTFSLPLRWPLFLSGVFRLLSCGECACVLPLPAGLSALASRDLPYSNSQGLSRHIWFFPILTLTSVCNDISTCGSFDHRLSPSLAGKSARIRTLFLSLPAFQYLTQHLLYHKTPKHFCGMKT